MAKPKLAATWSVADFARAKEIDRTSAWRFLQRSLKESPPDPKRPWAWKDGRVWKISQPLFTELFGSRVDDDPIGLREEVDEVGNIARATSQAQRLIADQVGQNTRFITKLQHEIVQLRKETTELRRALASFKKAR
jgi:hypothetical protein